ncbi:NAD(P)-binding protein [Streptomyces coffeae]|uniref:NAD(P)-binding protein n=1 Tax=Streptomyces coffeae TaxID=621382 RepID=UPI0027DC933A|nr:FAD-dependent oxidoreductase [Streptomyces coffeae]
MNAPTTAELPVVVIGAGPTGLAAAAHLIDRGITPLVLEAGQAAGAAVRQWAPVTKSANGRDLDLLLRQFGLGHSAHAGCVNQVVLPALVPGQNRDLPGVVHTRPVPVQSRPGTSNVLLDLPSDRLCGRCLLRNACRRSRVCRGRSRSRAAAREQGGHHHGRGTHRGDRVPA